MSWWRRGRDPERSECELNAELRDHVERQVADHVRAGMSAREARRRVRLEFGGLDQVKELCRDVRGTRRLEEIRHDLRFAMRLLVRQRAFTVGAILVLALGIGAAAAVLSVGRRRVAKTRAVRGDGPPGHGMGDGSRQRHGP